MVQTNSTPSTSIVSSPNMLRAAVGLAERGFWIAPLCWPVGGQCGCSKNHQGHDIGKAPLTRHGIKDSSNQVRDLFKLVETLSPSQYCDRPGKIRPAGGCARLSGMASRVRPARTA